MSQQTELHEAGATPKGNGQLGASWAAFDRLRARLWFVVAAAALLYGFVLFSGLDWRAALTGGVLVALVAAFAPASSLGRAETSDEEKFSGHKERLSSFDDVLQALPHPAVLLTTNGTVVGYNASAREHWDNLRRGGHLSSAIRQPVLLDAVVAVSGGAKPTKVNYTERVPLERQIEATVAGLPSSRRLDPEGPAMLVSLRDLSEQERLNQMRADFVANASHELRTPLASLLGFIETLQGPAREDEKAHDRFLSIMAAQAQRMTRLIDDLLSLSRVEMNVHLHPTDHVDLRDAVGHVTETLAPMAKEAGMKLVTEMPPEAVLVRGDRDELVQLTQNLLQNAIKYGRKKGRIDVTVSRLSGNGDPRNRVSIAVKDDGKGIAPEHLPRLTERFYRVDVTSSREKGGTGLGLAIVKHIVMRHRGDLQITSKPGKGSTFTVVFEEAGTESGGQVKSDVIKENINS